MTSGYLGGTGVLNTGSASFGSAGLGWSTAEASGVINVSGATSFAGSSATTLKYGQVLNLNGNSTWSAGNGRIAVEQAFAGSSSANPHAASALNITAGTTFTDAGAAAAGGTKQIGYSGGQVNNAGMYVRNGLGSTAALGFNNTGLLQVQSGEFTVTGAFSNAGDIQLAAGAELAANNSTSLFANAGTLQGNGTVRAANATSALLNSGRLLADSAGGLGQLSVVGDLTLSATSALGVDLGSGGQHDPYTIGSDLFADGVLQVQAVDDYAPTVGDSFVVATFAGSRRAGSTFDEIVWQGAGQMTLTAEYNLHDITLRVSAVTAVPEPQTWLMLLGGLAAVAGMARHRAGARQTLG